MKDNLPLVPIEKFSLEESQYQRGNEIWMESMPAYDKWEENKD